MSVQVEIHKFRSVIEPKKICKGHIADILLFNCERLSPISARLRHLPRLFRCSVAKCCETRANLKTEEKKNASENRHLQYVVVVVGVTALAVVVAA